MTELVRSSQKVSTVRGSGSVVGPGRPDKSKPFMPPTYTQQRKIAQRQLLGEAATTVAQALIAATPEQFDILKSKFRLLDPKMQNKVLKVLPKISPETAERLRG